MTRLSSLSPHYPTPLIHSSRLDSSSSGYPKAVCSYLDSQAGTYTPSEVAAVIVSHALTNPSDESEALTARRIARPTHSLRRDSSYLKRLELDAAQQKERFGLADVQVSTSPADDGVFIDIPCNPPDTQDDKKSLIMSQGASPSLVPPQNPSPVGSPNGNRTPTPAITVPTTSRLRHPVPPSPLSRIDDPHLEHHHHHHHHQHEDQTDTSSTAHVHRSSPSQLSPPGPLNLPENSPCFIHSHLDRHGSLQDWLKNKSGSMSSSPHNTSQQPRLHGTQPYPTHLHNGPSPVRQNTSQNVPSPRHHHGPHHHLSHSASSTPGTSRVTSPSYGGSTLNGKEGNSNNGYESDRSSPAGGSAILDGDLIDEEEERGSLTRQLAETAQGVREMSKELGRTRVRSRVQHVLIVTKARDNRLIKLTRELALYLMQKKPASSPDAPARPGSAERGMVVYVDAQLRTSKRFDAPGLQRDWPNLFQPVGRRRSSSSTSVSNLSAFPSTSSLADAGKRRDEGQLRYWTSEMCSNSPQLFDFVITLGGDGTVLFTSWLFQRIVPPVLPFALGSLGFLTNFDFSNYRQTMDKVVDDGIRVNLRMRFTCTVYRAVAPEEAELALKKGKGRKAIKKPGGEILMSQVDRGGWEALEGPTGFKEDQVVEGKDKEIMCFSTRPVEQFEVLNDLVVDRGPSPFVSLLELFGDEHHLTTVQADGLTVSTPTGSTAYSLSAGGSLVHPQIPALLITPICPHTLSFRPMLLPDSMELRICVPYNSRSTAWASFDGRGRVELKQGDHIKVTASKYPFPTVCADKASTDWFSSISRTLRWNEREKQKSFVVVEEENDPPRARHEGSKGHRESVSGMKKRAERNNELKNGEGNEVLGEEDEEDDDEEEEGEYDIDDKSGGELTNPSSPRNHPTDPRLPPNNLLNRLDPSRHKSGVHTPGRFATPYEGPPPLSQRHLVEALAAAELQDRDGEVGQRDDIRSGPEGMRVDSAHLIPSGRSNFNSPVDESTNHNFEHDQRTPRPSQSESSSTENIPARNHDDRTHSHSHSHQDHSHSQSYDRAHGTGTGSSTVTGGRRRKEESKAKAFAFFGQDDSASDLSDDQY